MTGRKPLSICYAAPGANFVPTAGPTRNVLNLAEALSDWAEVTVAFRRIQIPPASKRYRAVAIDPETPQTRAFKDDNAVRGLHPLDHLTYCRTLRSFAARNAGNFDVVLEKGWRLSGYLGAAFQRNGVPGILIENDVRLWTERVTSFPSAAKYGLHLLAELVSRVSCRRLPVVIAETDELKALLVGRRGIPAEHVEVVGLGVDHGLFRPMDQSQIRAAHGIAPDKTVLLYVGAMDEYHDVEPVIDALGQVRQPSVELHVVGEGEYRARCEAKALAAGIPARFHGSVPHDKVPEHIATADLCLAPYRTRAFFDGRVPFSTLKIPEYMACGRAVVSVPGGSIARLIEDGVSGFVLPNDVPSWVSFLNALPARERLASMGCAAARALTSVSWNATARRYFEVCERCVGAEARRLARRLPPVESHGR
jgi:glycosyltransferase involved in cell wall biosynthesis